MGYIKKNLGKQIKKFRTQKKISQEILAEKIGISPNNLGKIERGLNFITADNLERLSAALDVKMSDLFNFEDEPPLDTAKKYLYDFIENSSEEKILLLYKFINLFL
jgi:transcriptional regulator with XRE-family HTH domain